MASTRSWDNPSAVCWVPTPAAIAASCRNQTLLVWVGRPAVLLLKVSNKEYWLIELHYLDTEIGILELAFAKVSAQGRAEIPEAGFEQGPVDTEKAGEIQNHFLMLWRWATADGFRCTSPHLQDDVKFAFDLMEPCNINAGVQSLYAGDDFFENIETLNDLEVYFNDASSIPVRLDGRGSTSLSN